MAVETETKVGLFPSDEITHDFLQHRDRGDSYEPLAPDADANYEQVIPVNLGGLEPVLSFPHAVDSVFPVSRARCIQVQ